MVRPAALLPRPLQPLRTSTVFAFDLIHKIPKELRAMTTLIATHLANTKRIKEESTPALRELAVIGEPQEVAPSLTGSELHATSLAENLSIVHSFDGESFLRFYFNGDSRNSFFTSSHGYRLQCYSCELGNIFNVQQYWKHNRYRQKNIWLPNWLRREIQTLIKFCALPTLSTTPASATARHCAAGPSQCRDPASNSGGATTLALQEKLIIAV
ncbi:hypothetical protein KSP40_PGU013771 [Platanthera guangdongensis]|uniref:Uncharacterized protein n=1 Tax=Platanthera guangdongensis TaxID=2320717 RepID=A0ABR2LSQ8_9ASPA